MARKDGERQRKAELTEHCPFASAPRFPPTARPLTTFYPRFVLVCLCLQVKTAQITAVDRLGMYVLVTLPNGESGKLRTSRSPARPRAEKTSRPSSPR